MHRTNPHPINPDKLLVQQQLHGYQEQKTVVVREMEEMAVAFKKTFRAPYPVYLSIQKLSGGAVYLRWRKCGVKGQQPYLQINGTLCQCLLTSLPSAIRQVFLDFHRQAIALNYRHALLVAEKRRLEFYLEQLYTLDELQID